jgi:hypothetical protein
MATTMHCEPKRSEASLTSCGLNTAEVLIDTLSAPACSRRRTSSGTRTPPPTVSGMNTCAATVLDDMQDQVAVVRTGSDVQKGQLVGALLVIAPGDLDRIAGVAQVDELDALDDAPGSHVQAGNDALGETHRRLSSSASRCASVKSSVPS